MAIDQAICTVFKADLMNTASNLEADTLKMALYTSSATLSQTTPSYSATDEVPNSGTYTAGGKTLTNVAISVVGNTAIFDCDNVTFTSATISAQAAVIYNNSLANAAICVLDFNSVKSSSSGTFEVQIPNPDATNGLIRIQ
tara:strand:+ start:17732 stop:18154 length:423 start_codon:yes stop_codon:yes gene_type:complete